MYTVKLVKLSAPTTVINSATFITSIAAANVTTLKIVNANVATGVNNTSFVVSAEYNTTAAQLLAALEPTQAGATLKVLSATGGYEVAGTVKVTNTMVVEVTAKDTTTKKEYTLTVKAGNVTGLTVIDANVASLTSTTLTVDEGTTVAQLLAAIKLDDNKATVKALSKAVSGVTLAGTSVLTDGTTPASSDANILRVTAQDGTTDDYTIAITAVVKSDNTSLKSLDLNKATVVNTALSESITVVDTDNIKTVAQLLAVIKTVDSKATVKVLGATAGSEVPATYEFVAGTTVVAVTAEDGTVVEYTIN